MLMRPVLPGSCLHIPLACHTLPRPSQRKLCLAVAHLPAMNFAELLAAYWTSWHINQPLPQHASFLLMILLLAAATNHTCDAKIVGSVLGHESCVVQSIQQCLRQQGIALREQTNDPADVTLLFHRKKARLPQDEIQSLLASAQGIFQCLKAVLVQKAQTQLLIMLRSASAFLCNAWLADSSKCC